MVKTTSNGTEGGNSDPEIGVGESGQQGGSFGTEDETIYSSDADGIPTVEPTTITASDNGGKRGRGRPRGKSANASASRKQTKETASDLTALLMSGHMMLAAIVKTPELELDKTEAERLGEAVARVNELYGGVVFSPKAAAWLNLSMAAGAIYGPRAMAVKMRIEADKKEKPHGASVTPISKAVIVQ